MEGHEGERTRRLRDVNIFDGAIFREIFSQILRRDVIRQTSDEDLSSTFGLMSGSLEKKTID
jgi:hypothetical protein